MKKILLVVIALIFVSCSDKDNDSQKLSPCVDADVAIGTQTWKKCNLNVEANGSKCYDNEADNCSIYGRLYDWATAMNLPGSCNSTSCADQIDTPHQGICPDGWHIPTYEEWSVLVEYAGGSVTAGGKLKAEEGWNNDGNGSDDYGFAALPGGYCSYGAFGQIGDYGQWWTAASDEYNNTIRMSYSYEAVNKGSTGRESLLLSVRCLRD